MSLWKRSEEYAFLRECPSQVLQQKLMDLDRAFRDAFDRSQPLKRLPVFKKKGRGDGIMCFAVFSDGTMIDGVHSFRKHEKRLAREQRKLKNKQKGSSNWQKQKMKISRLHHHICNVRSDYLHKLSTRISETQARVYVENLQITNISASARGTIDAPGTGVRAKSGLNRSILDQGWFEFRRQLDYKLAWKGGELVEVDYRHTSQRCSVCGYTAKENRPAQALFRCMVCGHEENADVNAARNIITAGLAELACRANYTGSRQQNPFRARVSKPVGTREIVLPTAS